MNTHTFSIKNQIRRFYATSFLAGISMTGSVWIIFLLARGFTMLEVGIAEGFFHVVSLLFEIPSGAVADLIGRKRVLIAGRISMAISCLLMIASNSLPILCVAMGFCALSYNLNSGTEDAIVYDSLKAAGKEERFLKISANKGLLYRIAEAISNACSFISVSIGFVFCYLVNIIVSLSSVAVLTQLKEPELPRQAEKPKLGSFPAMFGRHLKTSFSFMLGHLPIAARMFLDCSLATMYTLLVFFMQQHIVSSGLPAKFVGIPLVMIGIGHFAGNRTAHAYAGKIGYGRLALLSLLIGGAGALLASSRLIPLSVIGSVIMGFFATLLEIATSARINAEIPSAQRATLISVSSMMYSVIMVGASPLIGFLCDSISTSAAFVIQGIYLVFIAAAGFTALAIRRLNKRKSLTADDTAR